MTDNLSLFGDEPTSDKTSVEPMPIADWLVQRLRDALDARGMTSMEERQRVIESAAGRPVESLRGLTYQEGLRVLASFEKGSGGGARNSSWNDRDEDTWIDRM